MFQFLLFAALTGLAIWYFWKKYYPLFTFQAFLLNWHLISTMIRQKGPRNKPLSIYFFHVLEDICKKYLTEGMIVLWLTEPLLVIYGPEAIKFFANEPSLITKPWVYNFFDFFGSDGIFRSTGEQAKQFRKLFGSSFYRGVMKKYVATINEHAIYLVKELKYLENNTANDILKISKARSMSLIFEVLGIDRRNGADDSRIEDLVNLITSLMEFVIYRVYRPWLHFDFMVSFSTRGRKHLKNKKDVQAIIKEIVEELKDSYEKRNRSMSPKNADSDIDEQQSKFSYGDYLLEQHLNDPSSSMSGLVSEFLALITTGFETVSYSLQWTLWLLGSHQDIQEKAHQEIKSICGEVIEFDEIGNLRYLECIIKESLRLYSVIPIFARQCDKDLYFDGHKIPTGTSIIFYPHLLHRNPEVYPEGDKFNPDRFAESESNIKPWSFIPFAESVRSCIGKNYAMVVMKVLLAHVIRNFEIVSLTQKKDVEVSWEIMLKSSVPLSVKFIPR